MECILEMKIEQVHVRTEENMVLNPEFRGIRLDVIAADENHTMYNVEMQTDNKGNLPRRSRLYQAEMDVAALLPGRDFRELPDCFVIFICTFDPFGENCCRYDYCSSCKQTGKILGDGATHIFLNTRGVPDADTPKALVDFLKFVENTTSEFARQTEQDFLKRISEKIAVIKNSRRVEASYMRFEELLQEREMLGRETQLKESMELIAKMIADNRQADIARLTTDPEFYQEMLRFYGADSPKKL